MPGQIVESITSRNESSIIVLEAKDMKNRPIQRVIFSRLYTWVMNLFFLFESPLLQYFSIIYQKTNLNLNQIKVIAPFSRRDYCFCFKKMETWDGREEDRVKAATGRKIKITSNVKFFRDCEKYD